MMTNMGTIDRLIRFIVAIVIAFAIYLVPITGGWAIGLGLVAFVLAATALVGFCPLYVLFGISTKERTLGGR